MTSASNQDLPFSIKIDAYWRLASPRASPSTGGWPGTGPSRCSSSATRRRHVHAVHRLDRATSGVLLFALDPGTAGRMQELFAEGRVEKRYLALVRGIPPESGVIDHPIPRDVGGPRVPAVTEFRRLAAFERYALIEARPRTGRLHQIRRHLKHISHPLIGDVRYGKGEHNRLFRERFGLHRLALHALELAFEHPETGEPVRIVAPVPEDLAGPLRAMGVAGVWR